MPELIDSRDDRGTRHRTNNERASAPLATMTLPTPSPTDLVHHRFAKYAFRLISESDQSASPGGFERKEYAKLVLEVEKLHLEREKLAHTRWWQEDALVNQRLTWLLTTQGAMFAAYVATTRPASDALKPRPDWGDVVAMLPLLGGGVCVVIAFGVLAANLAQRTLSEDYRKEGIELGVSRATNMAGQVTGWLLPVCFISGWGWLSQGSVCRRLFAHFPDLTPVCTESPASDSVLFVIACLACLALLLIGFRAMTRRNALAYSTDGRSPDPGQPEPTQSPGRPPRSRARRKRPR